MGPRLVYLVVVAGCGRIGFDVGFDATDMTAPVTCTPVDVADDFDDGVVSPVWFRYAQSTVGVVETGGRLEIAPVADQGGGNYGGYISRAFVDMRDHCIFVTQVATPAAQGDVEMQMIVQFDSSSALGISTEKAQLEAFENIADTITPIGLMPHDPVAHRIVRIREAGGTAFWETSADGVTFVQRFAAPVPFDFSAVQVLVQAGTFGAVANPGTAVFDNFDLPE